MTPKEKSEKLVNKYRILFMQSDTYLGEEILCTTFAKQCALIAVDEVLEENMERDGMRIINNQYWLNVKQEIEKL